MSGHSAMDMNLYSRQIHTIGYEAMAKLTALRVLISGMNGTGLETAKNLILAGPRKVAIHDETLACISDLGSNCYLDESCLGHRRAAGCLEKLRALNSYVSVSEHVGQIIGPIIDDFDLVVAIDYDRVALETLSLHCRERGVKLVAVNSFGLCASIYVDFGESFIVHDTDGELPRSFVVSHVTILDDRINIRCIEEKKLSFTVEDTVCLQDIEIARSSISNASDLLALAKVPLKVLEVEKYALSVALPAAGASISIQGMVPVSARVTNVKSAKTLRFKPYRESCLHPVAEGETSLTLVDYAKIGRAEQLHICTQALLRSVMKLGGRLPDVRKDFDQLLSAANAIRQELSESAVEGSINCDKVDEDVLMKICRFAGVTLAPLSVILGGIVAQEVVKATGKYTPIHQWLYLDFFEVVSGVDHDADPKDFEPIGSRYDDCIQIWGKKNQAILANSSLFLVGAGALGCEYLKNFALLGISTGPRAELTVTDMDRIEVSNLNRQFLFRKAHVGKSKSLTATEAVRAMNPDIHVRPLEARVGVDSELTIFPEPFWEGLDAVVNALDNVPSRLYIDGKCVWHLKPLIESGTLGTKGNVQVVVPHMTQSYGDSRDPPDEAIPLCTLRLFPHLIDHTMEWARDLFQGSFTGAVQETNNVIKAGGSTATALAGQGGMQLVESLERISAILGLAGSDGGLRKCVELSMRLFQKLFHDDILQLLYNFPVDHMNSDGTPFWVGSKRPPQPLEWNAEDETQMDFVEAGSKLYWAVTNKGAICPASREELRRIAATIQLPEFRPKKLDIKITDEDMGKSPTIVGVDDLARSRQDELERLVKDRAVGAAANFTALEFEKDDDANYHIQFIAAAGNLRARNYRIPEIERWRAKLIAGKIIPAIATTTAMVTGFATIELIKVLTREPLKRPLENFKDLFANLSLPLWLLSEPMGPKVMRSVDYDPIVGAAVRCKPETFTPWEKIVVDLTKPGCAGTMNELITQIEQQYETEVTILSAGNVCLYMSYAKSNKRDKPMREVIREAVAATANSDLSETTGYCIVHACCTDADGTDVNIPVIKCIY